MIKIIKKGKKTFETTCTQCGCKFSYELEDIGTLIGGKVKCPCCDEYIWHENQATVK